MCIECLRGLQCTTYTEGRDNIAESYAVLGISKSLQFSAEEESTHEGLDSDDSQPSFYGVHLDLQSRANALRGKHHKLSTFFQLHLLKAPDHLLSRVTVCPEANVCCIFWEMKFMSLALMGLTSLKH